MGSHARALDTLGCAGIVVDVEVEVCGRYLGGVCAAHAHTYAVERTHTITITFAYGGGQSEPQSERE